MNAFTGLVLNPTSWLAVATERRITQFREILLSIPVDCILDFRTCEAAAIYSRINLGVCDARGRGRGGYGWPF